MIPLLLVGPPGIGKTAKTKAQFDHVEVLLLSSSTEEDVSGLPFIKEGEEARTIPLFIRKLQEADQQGKTTCLFLDELDKARREVADTLLSLVVDPVSFSIPANTVLRAAANPPEWGGGDGISDAMLSRWCIKYEKMDEQAINELMLFWGVRYASNDYATNIIQKILSIAETRGLMEVSGEGLSRRITCPRTLTMVLDEIVQGTVDIKTVSTGLLTASFCSIFSESSSFERARKAVKVSLQREPLRVS